MKRFFIVIAVAVAAVFCWMAHQDHIDSTSATAPNGDPIGAQHPRSEQP